MSPAATAGRSPMRQRLPIMPDQSEHPSVSPAGQGSSSGSSPQAFEAGAEQQDQLRKQIQQSTAARAAQSAAAQRDPNSAGSPASVAAYQRARDTGIGRDNQVTSGQQRQLATNLGIDPSSDAKTIAAAASGPVGFDANGMPTGGDTRQAGPTIAGAGPQPPASTPGNVQPTPGAVTSAVQQIQAQKDGAQRQAVAQATSTGLGIRSPFSAASAPQPSTTAPMALRDGTTATAPPPAPVTAPTTPPTYLPAKKTHFSMDDATNPPAAGANSPSPTAAPAASSVAATAAPAAAPVAPAIPSAADQAAGYAKSIQANYLANTTAPTSPATDANLTPAQLAIRNKNRQASAATA